MDAKLWRFALAVLATWRVTHLLANEDGPADLVFRFRKLLARSWAGKLMDCFNCLSIWIAAPAALYVSLEPVEWCFVWLGLSGGACLLEALAREPVVFEPMRPSEEGESSNVLWSETLGSDARLPVGNGEGDAAPRQARSNQ